MLHPSQNSKLLSKEELYLTQQLCGVIFNYNGVLGFVGNVSIFGVDNRNSNHCENKYVTVLVFIWFSSKLEDIQGEPQGFSELNFQRCI